MNLAPSTITEGAAPLTPDLLPPLDAAPAGDSSASNETETEATPASAAATAAAGFDEPTTEAGPTIEAAVAAGLTPAALVQLCDAVLYLTVRTACATRGVEFGDEQQRLARLSKLERADLLASAPLAIPYLNKQFQAAPEWTGAAVFGVTFAFTAWAHVGAATARRVDVEE